MKVLHLPSNLAGNAFGLVQGERMLGLDSRALSFSEESGYQFPGDLVIPVKKTPLHHFYHRLKTFLSIRDGYDVYHFNAGSSLLHHLNLNLNLAELPFYSKSAIKIVSYQGCDARQKYPTIERIQQKGGYAACFSEGCYKGMCNSGKRDIRRRKAIDKMMQYCHHAFALNPDLLHFLPPEKSSFLPYTVPNFDSIPQKSNPFFENDKIRIVHAPTQRVTKGSDILINAINILEQKYPNKIEFQLIEKKPYHQALKIYSKADLVIDQLLIGWYGGLAVEVMKMGIPVAAYINQDDLMNVPTKMAEELPIINVSPENLIRSLEEIVKHRESIIEKGKESKQFVEHWHHPKVVANITKKIYQDAIRVC